MELKELNRNGSQTTCSIENSFFCFKVLTQKCFKSLVVYHRGQSSALFFFVLFFNDITDHVKHYKVVIYADDTVLYWPRRHDFFIPHLVPFCFIKLHLTLFSNQFSSGSADMSDKIKRENNQISLLHPQITGVVINK